MLMYFFILLIITKFNYYIYIYNKYLFKHVFTYPMGIHFRCGYLHDSGSLCINVDMICIKLIPWHTISNSIIASDITIFYISV